MAGGLAGCAEDEPAGAPAGAGTAATAPARPKPPAAPAVALRVVDGDTGAPVAGARVRGGGSGGPVSATTDERGRAALPAGVRTVVARAPRYAPARAPVGRRREVTVEAYRPALQSPEYGGGPARTRYVPAVRVGPPGPDERPDWTFDAITLMEFPPVVRDGLAVVGVNSGRVFALDTDSGEVVWARRQRGPIAASPAFHRDRVLVSSMDGMLSAYRVRDGAPAWRFPTGGSPIESSPLIAAGNAVVGTWDGTLYAVDAQTGRVAWTYRAPGDIKGSAALAGDLVVVGDYAGNVHALDARTGAARWVYSGGQRFYGGPGVSGNTVVIGDVGGAVIALDARTGAERWRHGTGGYVYASPAVAGGAVYVGSYSGHLERLRLDTGAVTWSFDAGGRISGSATVVDGVVYTSVLYRPGEPRRTYGLDVRDGSVVYRGADGRYSPAVAAGETLFLVGTRLLRAWHRDDAAA